MYYSEIARWSATDGRCQAFNSNGFYGISRLLKVFTQVKQQQQQHDTNNQHMYIVVFR